MKYVHTSSLQEDLSHVVSRLFLLQEHFAGKSQLYPWLTRKVTALSMVNEFQFFGAYSSTLMHQAECS